MPQISVNITDGPDKENVVAVTVGNRRWGHNGVTWGTPQNVAVGPQVVTIFKATLPNLTANINVEAHESTINISVDATSGQIEQS
ncbi:hypothetical protein [Paraburkholderia aspalathi]|uniref:hypothetical protein n=1 Tax=Paraburkholderia aspalathi TaxID=1324617 RepID=UPI003C835E48